MRAYVTLDELEDGIPQSPDLCPIALAIEKACGCTLVKVYDEYVLIDGEEVALPLKAQAFIEDFDEGRKPYPIEFELDYEPWL